MAWIKCTKTEAYLSRLGIDFDYDEAIPISELEANWKSRNPGREKGVGLIEEKVVEYGDAHARRECFPPAIVTKRRKGYDPLDGRQRIAGAEMIGETIFAAYVIAPGVRTATLDRIALGANCKLNGLSVDINDRISRAIDFMLKYDCSPAEAAEMINVRVEHFERKLRVRKSGEIMRARGVETNKLSETNLHTLEPLAHIMAPKEMTRFVKLIEDTRVNGDDVKAMAEELLALRNKQGVLSVTQQRSKLREFEKRPEIECRISAKGTRHLHPFSNLMRELRSAQTLLRSVKASDFDAERAKQVNDLWSDVTAMLRARLKTSGYDLKF